MISFLENFGIQVNATPEGGLNLKGLSGLTDETRQEVLDFARENKAAILSELQPGTTKPSQKRDTCPWCGQSQWWRKNEPNSKWICGRCHPPAPGLDVKFELKTKTETEKPERILAILEAVDGIRDARFKVSDALGGCVALLEGKPLDHKNKKFCQFIHRVGRAIKHELLKIDRACRADVVLEAAITQGFFDDGLTSLDEVRTTASTYLSQQILESTSPGYGQGI